MATPGARLIEIRSTIVDLGTWRSPPHIARRITAIIAARFDGSVEHARNLLERLFRDSMIRDRLAVWHELHPIRRNMARDVSPRGGAGELRRISGPKSLE